MLKIEKCVIPSPEQWEIIIEATRNPKNSWHLMDSGLCDIDGCINCFDCVKNDICDGMYSSCEFELGKNDHKLLTSLAKGGPVHAKYRRMIPVFVTINAPLYWWKEFDTYKQGTVTNSCSTMHKIHAKEFTLDDFSTDHLEDFSWNRLDDTITHMNICREKYLAARKTEKETGLPAKDIWWQMIQLLPTSYNQKRTIMLNYEVLHNIYFSRKDHKLDEWHVICDWIETLPHSEIITTPMKNSNIEIEDAIKVLQDAGYLVCKRDDDSEDCIEFKRGKECDGCVYEQEDANPFDVVANCFSCIRCCSMGDQLNLNDNYASQEVSK